MKEPEPNENQIQHVARIWITEMGSALLFSMIIILSVLIIKVIIWLGMNF